MNCGMLRQSIIKTLIGDGSNQYGSKGSGGKNKDAKELGDRNEASYKSRSAPSGPDSAGRLKGDKLAKHILGGTSKTRTFENGDTLHTWEKRGGHPNAKLQSIDERLEAQGFKVDISNPTGTPDGSHMGHDKVLYHPDGHSATVSKSYGNTKDDNWFSAKVRIKKS
jgi:hypothetical protein